MQSFIASKRDRINGSGRSLAGSAGSATTHHVWDHWGQGDRGEIVREKETDLNSQRKTTLKVRGGRRWGPTIVLGRKVG